MSENLINLSLILIASGFTLANWLAAWFMYQASTRKPDNRLLRLAAIRGVVRAVATSLAVFAWVDIMRDFVILGREGVIVLVFFIVVGVALPSVYFLYLFWTGQLVKDNPPPL